MRKLDLAIVKLASCSGCLNEVLYSLVSRQELLKHLDILYFTEFQDLNDVKEVDLAIVEGSVATSEHEEFLKLVREKSRLVLALGTCAVYGGVQSLRVGEDLRKVVEASYPNPSFIEVLPDVKSVDSVVSVDYKLPGCPVNGESLARLLVKLALGGSETPIVENLCSECKRRGVFCVTVLSGKPCLGPVVMAGCGALCPSFGRGCYGCYGLSTLVVDRERLEEFLKTLEKFGVGRDDLVALLKAYSYSSLSKLIAR
ncbi:MAG: hypothetical protein RMH84_01785 [Sulfolobales archaeon]|nr:hypothetical protein [Sulfolobales archaeon]MCX8208656.1 hypothetical protein [Sulfolobales archaeon]MDW8010314.1 hypothetical protein [Sulfolobales archaeon]